MSRKVDDYRSYSDGHLRDEVEIKPTRRDVKVRNLNSTIQVSSNIKRKASIAVAVATFGLVIAAGFAVWVAVDWEERNASSIVTTSELESRLSGTTAGGGVGITEGRASSLYSPISTQTTIATLESKITNIESFVEMANGSLDSRYASKTEHDALEPKVAALENIVTTTSGRLTQASLDTRYYTKTLSDAKYLEKTTLNDLITSSDTDPNTAGIQPGRLSEDALEDKFLLQNDFTEQISKDQEIIALKTRITFLENLVNEGRLGGTVTDNKYMSKTGVRDVLDLSYTSDVKEDKIAIESNATSVKAYISVDTEGTEKIYLPNTTTGSIFDFSSLALTDGQISHHYWTYTPLIGTGTLTKTLSATGTYVLHLRVYYLNATDGYKIGASLYNRTQSLNSWGYDARHLINGKLFFEKNFSSINTPGTQTRDTAQATLESLQQKIASPDSTKIGTRTNLGTIVPGVETANASVGPSILSLINTYLINELTENEYKMLKYNKDKLNFQIGIGDTRASETINYIDIPAATWNGEDQTRLALTTPPGTGPYAPELKWDWSTNSYQFYRNSTDPKTGIRSFKITIKDDANGVPEVLTLGGLDN